MEADIDLLEAWCAGDGRAGDALLRRYFEALHRFFSHKVDDEVDDLIQRTFLALVRSKHAVREAASFRAYVFTVARHELFHHLGARRRTREALDFGSVSVADLGTSPSGAFARRKEQAALLRALRAIPVELQVALELHYWEGLTTAELASVLAVPQGTAKSTLRRAREQLEAKLRRGAGAPAEAALGELEAWARAIREAARSGRS